MSAQSSKSLAGLRVLDLSRVLAGPFCTQMLGDLGAEILKIEKPNAGDDTRKWGPPFMKDSQEQDSSESAYYLSTNRNKKSIALDIQTEEGRALLHRLIAESDILIQNFKVGGLEKYGLGYEQLKDQYPTLVYCTITGFGQNGPMAQEPGYDFLAQGLSGLMACTGAVDDEPMKVGVALSDVITGLNAAVGILAALNHRTHTGQGQLVDVALLDCSLAALTNIAQYYLTSATPAPRMGNAHSTIVPYQVFESTDGHVILAIGNDQQFTRLCSFMGQDDWAQDERFSTNSARVIHREILVPMIAGVVRAHSTQYWIDGLHNVKVPCGPVQSMDQVFEMEQIASREMKISMPHSLSAGNIDLVGNPVKLSKTPPSYDLPPPFLGQHTQDVLAKYLDLTPDEITDLQKRNIIEAGSKL